MERAQLKEIIAESKSRRGGVITILERLQSSCGYLSPEALELVAEETKRPLIDIYGTASFYKAFSLKPRGRHLVSACLGTACHVRGGASIAQAIEKLLGVGPGETTPDGEFTFETVNCLGACAIGPVVVVDGRYYGSVTRDRLPAILDEAKNGVSVLASADDERLIPLQVACSRCNHSLMDPAHPIDGLPSVRVTVSFGRRHGWMRISSLYGSHAVEAEHDVPAGRVVHYRIFCPHCHTELHKGKACPECHAPMASMIVRGGGMVHICTRHGCKGHMLDIG